MTKNNLFYMSLLITSLIGCNNDKFKESNNHWLKNIDTTNYTIDSSNAHRTTILSGNIDNLQRFLESFDNLKKKDSSFNKKKLILLADSLSKSLDITNNINPHQVLDTDYIERDKIRHNNRLAYKALLESSWKDSINSQDFREYLLPYKLTNEMFDNWRDSLYTFHQELILLHPNLKNMDSLYNYHISTTYNLLSSVIEMRNYFPSEENYSWLHITKEGECVARCRYAIYHLRAAGVPATYDYIPNWGNRPSSRHAYVGLANKKKQVEKLLKNDNDQKYLVDNLNAAMKPKNLHVFQEGDLPEGLYVQYEKTIPKMYRQTWSLQSEIAEALSDVPKEEIFPGLIKPNMIDVTSQYLDVGNAKVYKSFFQTNKLSYLSTFDINGWTPVAFSPFNWYGKAIFKDVGKNIVYLPTVFNGEIHPIGNPFVIESSGIKREFICNKDKLIDMKIIRKYPLFSNTARHAVGFKGSRIEGMNSLDEDKNIKLLHTIDYYPFGMQEIDLNVRDSLRYVQITYSDSGEKLGIAEFECFQDSLGVIKKIEDINAKNGLLEKRFIQPFDGDQKTHRTYKILRMDFGSPKPVSKIRFCPRSDSNYIIEGNSYELFYWDNGWVSKGVQIAQDNVLNYKNMPSGTIYWLRCLTEGKEERIFSYENGRQIWW